jgi:hypothetical protein
VIIWGYSLPATDLKARELLRISLLRRDSNVNVCVIDPSGESRDRWRGMFLRRRFWHCESIEQFFDLLEQRRSYRPEFWPPFTELTSCLGLLTERAQERPVARG